MIERRAVRQPARTYCALAQMPTHPMRSASTNPTVREVLRSREVADLPGRNLGLARVAAAFSEPSEIEVKTA